MEKNNSKSFKNSFLFQGSYSFNYLCNLCLISINCLDFLAHKDVNYNKDKNLKKSFNNLQAYLLAAYKLFGKLSEELNESKVIISDILYEEIKSENSKNEEECNFVGDLFDDVKLKEATMSASDIALKFNDDRNVINNVKKGKKND